MRRFTLFLFGAALLALVGCGGGSDSEVPDLDRAGWTDSAYDEIGSVIAEGAGQGRVALFDFDNTVQGRDVSEAVLGHADESGSIDPASVPAALAPPVTVDGRTVTVADGLNAYYEAVMDSGEGVDPLREYTSLPLVATLFSGRTVEQFTDEVASAYGDADGDPSTFRDSAGYREMASGGMDELAGHGRPFIYPQMADLVGNLRANGYEVWVVSAGVAWAVRWMVKNALNPAIAAKYGRDATLPLDHVIAITTIMRDRTTGALVSDYELVRHRRDRAYTNLDPTRLRQLEITALSDGLTPWRGGKSGAVDNLISRDDVYFAAGDSNGDLEMLDRSANRLVIARMNKSDLIQQFIDEIEFKSGATWIVQPTISTAPVGFAPTRCAMKRRVDLFRAPEETRVEVERSTSLLKSSRYSGSYMDC
jgi:phosphoserine phosphatase